MKLREFTRPLERTLKKIKKEFPKGTIPFIMIHENTSEEICNWLDKHNYVWQKYPKSLIPTEKDVKITYIKENDPTFGFIKKEN